MAQRSSMAFTKLRCVKRRSALAACLVMQHHGWDQGFALAAARAAGVWCSYWVEGCGVVRDKLQEFSRKQVLSSRSGSRSRKEGKTKQ